MRIEEERLAEERRRECLKCFGVPWDVHESLVAEGKWEWDEIPLTFSLPTV